MAPHGRRRFATAMLGAVLGCASLCRASLPAPPSTISAARFMLPKQSVGVMDDAASIGSRLVQLARARGGIRGGGEGADAGGGEYNSFATSPTGQPVLDDENDGELLASFVYEGIRPTISEDSQAASRGSLSHSPNAGTATGGAGAWVGGQKRAPMEPEAQRLLHHKLMMEATKAGKLKDHRSTALHSHAVLGDPAAHDAHPTSSASAAARAALPSQEGGRFRAGAAGGLRDVGAQGLGGMEVGEEGAERGGSGPGASSATSETRTLVSFEVMVPDCAESTRVKVVGGHQQLGDWQPEYAPCLEPVRAEPGIYYGELWLEGVEEGGEPVRMEYKYVLEVETGDGKGHAAVSWIGGIVGLRGCGLGLRVQGLG